MAWLKSKKKSIDFLGMTSDGKKSNKRKTSMDEGQYNNRTHSHKLNFNVEGFERKLISRQITPEDNPKNITPENKQTNISDPSNIRTTHNTRNVENISDLSSTTNTISKNESNITKNNHNTNNISSNVKTDTDNINNGSKYEINKDNSFNTTNTTNHIEPNIDNTKSRTNATSHNDEPEIPNINKLKDEKNENINSRANISKCDEPNIINDNIDIKSDNNKNKNNNPNNINHNNESNEVSIFNKNNKATENHSSNSENINNFNDVNMGVKVHDYASNTGQNNAFKCNNGNDDIMNNTDNKSMTNKEPDENIWATISEPDNKQIKNNNEDNEFSHFTAGINGKDKDKKSNGNPTIYSLEKNEDIISSHQQSITEDTDILRNHDNEKTGSQINSRPEQTDTRTNDRNESLHRSLSPTLDGESTLVLSSISPELKDNIELPHYNSNREQEVNDNSNSDENDELRDSFSEYLIPQQTGTHKRNFNRPRHSLDSQMPLLPKQTILKSSLKNKSLEHLNSNTNFECPGIAEGRSTVELSTLSEYNDESEELPINKPIKKKSISWASDLETVHEFQKIKGRRLSLSALFRKY